MAKKKTFTEIIDNSLSVRPRIVLKKLNITSLNRFLNLTEADCKKLRNCGTKTWNEIERTQKKFRENLTTSESRPTLADNVECLFDLYEFQGAILSSILKQIK